MNTTTSVFLEISFKHSYILIWLTVCIYLYTLIVLYIKIMIILSYYVHISQGCYIMEYKCKNILCSTKSGDWMYRK